jgi:hypothetical protein
MDDEKDIPIVDAETAGRQCVELECEYCACNCRGTFVTCMYTEPYTKFPKICPLNKW